MPILTVNGARLSYSIAGQGPAVVVLHGMTSNVAHEAAHAHDWQRELSDTHTVVAYDARGHGASTGRKVPEDYRWELLADDLLALLDTVSPDTPVDGVGASMGTATLLHAVLKAPQRFRRLVLTIPPTAWETRAAQSGLYRDGAQLIESSGLESFRRLVADQPVPPAMADLPPFEPEVDEALLPSIMRGAAMTDLPDPQALSTIQQPTLLLPWTEDPGHPVTTAERLLELLPHAEMAVAATAAQWRTWPERAREHLLRVRQRDSAIGA